jgi:hypothetical protein
MKKLMLIVSGVLLLITLPLTLIIFSQPAMVTQKNTLLTYQHQGAYNYAVSLKPSSLYGPQNSTQFPFELAQDLLFTFSSVSTDSGTYTIEAILSNSGIWNKVLPLTGPTPFTGSFAASGSLDMDMVRQTFSDIETQVAIPNPKRSITLSVSVKGKTEQYTHILPMAISQNVLDVSNALTQWHTTGSSHIDYSFRLKPNKIYPAPSLSPQVSSPPVLDAGDWIPMKLTDKMIVSLAYDFTASGELQNRVSTINITSRLLATSGWQQEYQLLKTTHSADFVERFSLDLGDMAGMVNALSAEAGAVADSYQITITAVINTTADSLHGQINDTFIATLQGTLKGNALIFSKQLSSARSGSINQNLVLVNPVTYLGVSLATVKIIMAVFVGILGLMFAFFLFRYLRSPKAAPTLEQEVARVRKKMGARLVECRDIEVEGHSVVLLDTIPSLQSVADELGKPVLHAVRDGVHEYFVVDGKIRYRYVLNPK